RKHAGFPRVFSLSALMKPGFFLKTVARIGVLAALLLVGRTSHAAASWESTAPSSAPPVFPNPRPLHARYGFGWSGFSCATVETRMSQAGGNRIQLDATARTTGFARALWKFDATHSS